MWATTAFMLVCVIGSSATTAPCRSATMRSQTANTSVSRWLIRMTAMPCALQLADQVEHVLDLAHRQRRRRLVHDDELGVEGERARDRHRLLLPAGQLADDLGHRWQPRAELARSSPRPRARMRAAVDHADRSAEQLLRRLAAEEDVGRHVLHARERQVLVDHLDAERADLAGLAAVERRAVEADARRRPGGRRR